MPSRSNIVLSIPAEGGRTTLKGQTAIHEVRARLILLGPVALRLKTVVPVVPGVTASVAGSDDAAS
jgi:hypothetical protein